MKSKKLKNHRYLVIVRILISVLHGINVFFGGCLLLVIKEKFLGVFLLYEITESKYPCPMRLQLFDNFIGRAIL